MKTFGNGKVGAIWIKQGLFTWKTQVFEDLFMIE